MSVGLTGSPPPAHGWVVSHEARKGVDHALIELAPSRPPQLLGRHRGLERPAVGPARGHRLVGVRHGEDGRFDRDLPVAAALRVAGSVGALV